MQTCIVHLGENIAAISQQMVASSSNFHPHPGRVTKDMFRQLHAVCGMVQEHILHTAILLRSTPAYMSF